MSPKPASPESEDLADDTPGVAVVTGAASGIGRAIALELARRGFQLVVHTRANQVAAEAVAAEISSQGGTSTVFLADLADPEQRDSLVERCWQWRGGVHVWINNAGADVLTGEPAEWSLERKMDHLWAVDVKGTFFLSREIGQRMLAAEQLGTIVNMGWDQAAQGMAGDSGELFATTKGAVMAFSRSLAQSLAPRIRVNCVAPGWIKTAWGDEAPEYWQKRATNESLLARWGAPDDVAKLVGFLVSSEASFITGQTIPVNGGFRYGDNS